MNSQNKLKKTTLNDNTWSRFDGQIQTANRSTNWGGALGARFNRPRTRLASQLQFIISSSVLSKPLGYYDIPGSARWSYYQLQRL